MLNKEKPVDVLVDEIKCTKCGLCIETCSSFLEKNDDGFPWIKKNSSFGCVQCGHCMMICPNNAIEIKGEDIDREHLRDLNPNLPGFDEINALFLSRRSCRKYKNENVSKEEINKIIDAAATAAVSIPPSEVKVLIFEGKEKVQELADEVIKVLNKLTKFMNPFTLLLLKLFAGKAQYKIFKDFVIPLSKEIIEKRNLGIDYLFYNAPCVMVFYGTEYTDKEDCLIAATQATIAAESLGLATCLIGTVGAALSVDKKLRKKYGILKTDKIGTGFILGYPAIKFKRAFQRKFKDVKFV